MEGGGGSEPRAKEGRPRPRTGASIRRRFQASALPEFDPSARKRPAAHGAPTLANQFSARSQFALRDRVTRTPQSL